MRERLWEVSPLTSWWGAGWVSSRQAWRVCSLTPRSALSHLCLFSPVLRPQSWAWSLPQTHVLWALFQALLSHTGMCIFGLAINHGDLGWITLLHSHLPWELLLGLVVSISEGTGVWGWKPTSVFFFPLNTCCICFSPLFPPPACSLLLSIQYLLSIKV